MVQRPFDFETATLRDVEDKIDEDACLLMSAHFKGHSGEADYYALELHNLRKLRFELQCERDREAGT